MPIYNAILRKIDAAETKRYAGLQKAFDFDPARIENACEDALLLSNPKGIWTLYDYDCKTHTIQAEPPVKLQGESIAKHLAGCEKVILLAATIGENIEQAITNGFEQGSYTSAVLLDAAATTAIEETANEMERAIRPAMLSQGYEMRFRFSPGYGDFPIEQQTEIMALSHAGEIGISLSSALMLVPRKSITAIIGLYKKQHTVTPQGHERQGCLSCPKTTCPARKI